MSSAVSCGSSWSSTVLQILLSAFLSLWHGDDADNVVEENFSIFSLVVVSKGMQPVKLLQQNPPVLNYWCWLMQVSCIMAVKW